MPTVNYGHILASDGLKPAFAVIYSPGRKRDRFPENTVTLYQSKQAAIESQDHERKFFAAEVIGPAKSSEGFKIFYLLGWLD